MGKKKIVIIKIGSSVILTRRNKLDEFRISHIGDQILTLKEKGFAVILVVSGAVACGFMTDASDRLHLSLKKDFSLLRQAAAGVGQVQLITAFNSIFRQKQLKIAQVLVNKNDLQDDIKRERRKKILDYYFQSGIIPVFNENDVVDLNSFGGNDFLAGELAVLIRADKLLILSSFQENHFSVGGGKTKQEVIDLLAKESIEAVIVDGKVKDSILTSMLSCFKT